MTTFGRVTEIQIGSRVIASPPLTIEFDIPFDDGSDGNVASVKLYNLGPDSLAVCETGQPIAVRSGYQNDIGLVTFGVIAEAVTQLEAADRVTTLTIGDGTDKWLTRYVNRSWSPGTKASQIVNDLVAVLGLDVGEIRLPEDVVYPNGRTLSTAIKTALEEIAKDTGAKLHVTNGAVYMVPPQQAQHEVIVLNARTGLLDRPYRDSTYEDAYRIKTLLQHRITTDSVVEIESEAVSGRFRVAEGRHVSDSGEHITECVVVPL
ncbi:MAG: hypothetical protein GXX08_08415 [Firmicutes bacterium]|nr:hypothetical protein [Bacillota bacterium]